MVAPTNQEVYLYNTANSKGFYFRCVTPFNFKKTQPSIDIPLVNTTAANRFIFRFTGQAEDITFSFVLFNDGQDVSGAGGIVTVKQQMEYLKNEVFTHEFDTDWNLTCSSEFTGSITGVVDNIDFSTPTGGNIRTGTITFKVGRIGLL